LQNRLENEDARLFPGDKRDPSSLGEERVWGVAVRDTTFFFFISSFINFAIVSDTLSKVV
jgi:hypothetical protein